MIKLKKQRMRKKMKRMNLKELMNTRDHRLKININHIRLEMILLININHSNSLTLVWMRIATLQTLMTGLISRFLVMFLTVNLNKQLYQG